MGKSSALKEWFIEYRIMFGLDEEKYHGALKSAESLKERKIVSEAEWRSMVRLANAGLMLFEKK
ncbi:hypothetical protein [Pseudomonas sp. Larv2_ips]|uniref:hypothetical protein n=1 Tax=Pseudomonas sp. Larv2_ips TaxID=1896942 RepID=UPI0013003FC4|nr:hypothetical protein [Pseudomonas sp. Larv2_ips]